MFALDNGLLATPPMGFNSYMAHTAGEKGLGSIADFFVSSGLRESGYTYINTDEGWETKQRYVPVSCCKQKSDNVLL
jgi:alpha-galactosidase